MTFHLDAGWITNRSIDRRTLGVSSLRSVEHRRDSDSCEGRIASLFNCGGKEVVIRSFAEPKIELSRKRSIETIQPKIKPGRIDALDDRAAAFVAAIDSAV